ncbi:MAG: alkaline phosphatase family protein [Saprospiraceae bacterium]|nr:alkaline phosphatase family protein [Saprospiraceae bacterium]MCB9321981.1 alkaline phosphatase family protein [Lewinellaceae bacterium]
MQRKSKLPKPAFVLLFCLGPVFISNAQSSLLQSGPMLGYSEMREVLLWVQTTEPAEVFVTYWEKDIEHPDTLMTRVNLTDEEEANTVKLIADQVMPGKHYQYQLYINGEPVTLNYPTEFQSQPIWKWRHDPPDFTMVTGSCAYINEPEFDRPGTPYGSHYEIFQAIYQQHPDMMLWLGDNTYLREADWFTATGYWHRYTHTRSIPELQPLLASTHHYAIWDDHDYGPNDSDRSWVHKERAHQVFQAFWGNPTYGIPGLEGGITTMFQFHDVDFFLLDDRWFRSPDKRKYGDRTMLGKKQLEWLLDALSTSEATFKIVATGNMVLSTAAVAENYSIYPEEQAYLIEQLEKEHIPGVVFLTGDRHYTELSKYSGKNGYVLYDLTCSPFTSGVNTSGDKENNAWLVPGTVVMEHNFARIHFSGPEKERVMTIAVFNAAGEKKWEREIRASEWK